MTRHQRSRARLARELGCTLKPTNAGHWRFVGPNGKTVAIAAGQPNGLKKTLRQIQRALKGSRE